MAGKFNDEDLRNLALRLTDPNDQPDLLMDIPEGAELLDIINIYSSPNYPAKKVYCAICRGHRHKRGFTAVLTTGHRVLSGSLCGGRKFGESWQQAEKRVEELAGRQFELKKFDRLTIIDLALHQKLQSWVSVFDAVEARRAAFNRIFGELASRLCEARMSGGTRLTYFKKVAGSVFSQAGGKGMTTQEVTVGSFDGPEFLCQLDTSKAVANAIDRIKGHRSSTGSTRTMKERRRAIEDAFEDLEKCVKIYHDTHNFLSVGNFVQLAHWTSVNDAFRQRLEVIPNGLRHVEAPDKCLTLIELPDLDESLINLIWEYRRAS